MSAEKGLLRGTVLIWGLILQPSTYANAPYCQASIQGQSAVFFIENRFGTTGIEWYLEATKPNEIEYMWTVTLGSIVQDGSFKGTDKRFAFMVVKRAKSKPSRGDLVKLLEQAIGVAWHTQSEIIQGAKMKIHKFKDGVILGTHDPDTFNRLFADHPTAAEIDVFPTGLDTFPGISATYSCVVRIEYE